MLAREIQAGILIDGMRLPPERKMAGQLGVAVGTLRKALLDLSEKGLIERVHGSGNYVRNSNGQSDTDSAKTIYGFFRLELIAGGGLPTAEVLSVSRVKKNSAIADIGDSEYGHRIRRLRRLNGVDAAIEEIWIDSNWQEKITRQALYDSLYLFYKEKLGFWISRVEDSVSALQLPAWKPDDFGSSANGRPTTKQTDAVWGYVERNSYDQTNSSVEFSRTWFDPDTTRYIARFK